MVRMNATVSVFASISIGRGSHYEIDAIGRVVFKHFSTITMYDVDGRHDLVRIQVCGRASR